MKIMKSTFFCIGLFVAVGFGADAHAQTPAGPGARAALSVVMVRALGDDERLLRSGSGVVTAAGQVVTNCHVLARAKSLQTKYQDIIYPASLRHADVERDLCMLNVPRLPAPAARIGGIQTVRLGQPVYAVSGGADAAVSEGTVSGLREYNGIGVIQTLARVSQGVSGVGLFDAEGRLLGITTILVKETGETNFAITADAVAQIGSRAQDALAKRSAAPATASAPAPNVAAAPVVNLPAAMPRVGDSWKYLYTDQWTKVSRGPIIYEVTAVTEQEIRESVRKDNSSAAEERTHSRAARFIDNSLMNLPEFAPYLQAFGKLETTATWDSVPAESGNINKWNYSGRVIGTETVSTAAGTFNTLRVQLEGRRTNSLPLNVMYIPEAIQATYIAWYSPEAKRFVKVTRELRTLTGNALDRDLYELVEYKLAPR
jgi:hypothetical protein